jgi:hypothetical protein
VIGFDLLDLLINCQPRLSQKELTVSAYHSVQGFNTQEGEVHRKVFSQGRYRQPCASTFTKQ